MTVQIARQSRSIADLPAPPGLPLAGNALQLRPDRLHLVLEGWARRHGDVFRVKLGRRTVVVFAGDEPLNIMLRERPEGFRRWSEIEQVFRELGIHGVFSAEGEDWRRQRKLAVMALNSNHLHRYYDVIRRCTGRLHAKLAGAARTGESCDLRRAFMSFTVDVTSALAFGYDLNTLESDSELQMHIERVLPLVSRRIQAPFPYWRYVKLPSDRAAARSLREIRAAVSGFIADARARMHARPELHERPENFLEGMLAGEFTDAEVFGNAFTMLLAGGDTTAFSLAWAAWYLANDRALQERVAREARAAFKDEIVAPDAAAADALLFTEDVLREAIRHRSAAPILFLEAIEDTNVAGVELPSGTQVLGLSRYADAENLAFDPDRDAPKLLSFGAGPRFCPGRNLALLEARSALAMIAGSFELSLDPTAPPVRERFGFTMHPSGLRVRLRDRTR